MGDTGAGPTTEEIGAYCRAVEDYLTRANAGHLVRIVGPGFELVRGWALAGVPLSIVYRGIDQKAERHGEQPVRRPLRIEFCEGDVRAVFESWRRAIGVWSLPEASDRRPRADVPGAPSGAAVAPDADGGGGIATPGNAATSKKPSLSKHLDRAIDRLSRVGGRLDLPVELRDACDRVLQSLAEMRALTGQRRPGLREELTARLTSLDADLASALRQHAPEALRAPLVAQAAADLTPYRGRLADEAWQRSVEITADRLLRDRLGVPVLEP